MERVPHLIGLDGPLEGQRFTVTPAGLSVGREPGNDIVVDDDAVSRQHARAQFHNGSVWIHDAGSRNGVFVNGKRVVRPRTVGPGDTLVVGPQTFTIDVEILDDATAHEAFEAIARGAGGEELRAALEDRPTGPAPELPKKSGFGWGILALIGCVVLIAVTAAVLLLS